MRTCVLHPDREAVSDIQAHPVCFECIEKRRLERQQNKPFKEQLFLQQILRAGYQLEPAQPEPELPSTIASRIVDETNKICRKEPS